MNPLPASGRVGVDIKIVVLGWAAKNFKEGPWECAQDRQLVHFGTNPGQRAVLASFKTRRGDQDEADYHYNALDFVLPRTRLLYDLSYDAASRDSQLDRASPPSSDPRVPLGSR